MVARSAASKYSILTVCKWETYQSKENPEGEDKGEVEGEQISDLRADKGRAEGGQRATEEECNKERTPSTGRFSTECKSELDRVGKILHDRHPAVRRCCPKAIRAKLEAICRTVPAAERIAKLQQINRNHEAYCATEQWRKDAGQFARGLSNWLSIREAEYDNAPGVRGHSSEAIQDQVKYPVWVDPYANHENGGLKD